MGYKSRDLKNNVLGLKYLDGNDTLIIYNLWNENLDIINSTLGVFNTVVGVDSTNNVLIYTNPELDFNKYKPLDIPSFKVVQEYVKDQISKISVIWSLNSQTKITTPIDNTVKIQQTAPQGTDNNDLVKVGEYNTKQNSQDVKIQKNTDDIVKLDKEISNLPGGVGLWKKDDQTGSISPRDLSLSVRVPKSPTFETDVVNKKYVDELKDHIFVENNGFVFPKDDAVVLVQPAPQSTNGDSLTKKRTFDDNKNTTDQAITELVKKSEKITQNLINTANFGNSFYLTKDGTKDLTFSQDNKINPDVSNNQIKVIVTPSFEIKAGTLIEFVAIYSDNNSYQSPIILNCEVLAQAPSRYNKEDFSTSLEIDKAYSPIHACAWVSGSNIVIHIEQVSGTTDTPFADFTLRSGRAEVTPSVAPTNSNLNYTYPPLDPGFAGLYKFFSMPVTQRTLGIYSFEFELGGEFTDSVLGKVPFLIRGVVTIGPISDTKNHEQIEILDVVGEKLPDVDLANLLGFYFDRPTVGTFTVSVAPKFSTLTYTYLKVSSNYSDSFQYLLKNLEEIPSITGTKVINVTTNNRSLSNSLYWKSLDQSGVVVSKGIVNVTFNLDLTRVNKPTLFRFTGIVTLMSTNNDQFSIDFTTDLLASTTAAKSFLAYCLSSGTPAPTSWIIIGSVSGDYPDLQITFFNLGTQVNAALASGRVSVFYR